MSPEMMSALRDGQFEEAERAAELQLPAEWEKEDWSWLRSSPEETAARPHLVDWLPHLVVWRGREGPQAVGEVGFHGPPRRGEAEIGYMIASPFRRKGYASEAAAGLLGWGESEGGLASVRASVDPGNLASLGVLRKLGFSVVGSYFHQERGDQLLLRLFLG